MLLNDDIYTTLCAPVFLNPKMDIQMDESNSKIVHSNNETANLNSELPLGEIPKINSTFGNLY